MLAVSPCRCTCTPWLIPASMARQSWKSRTTATKPARLMPWRRGRPRPRWATKSFLSLRTACYGAPFLFAAPLAFSLAWVSNYSPESPRVRRRGAVMRIGIARVFTGVLLLCSVSAISQTNKPNNPTWWDKYQYLLKNGEAPLTASGFTANFGSNVDVSNECFPQSEVYIALNQSRTRTLAAGSNEIFRDPMRGYFTSDGGNSWGSVDLPLPAPLSGTNDSRFGSDPSLAFDTKGNVFYSYIVVFFGGGNGVNGSEMAVAKSSDGGKTYPNVTYFSFESGSNHFNDKPMITTDSNLTSPFRDNVYAAWDASAGGSIGGGVRFGRSSDAGASFTVNRADDPKGPGKAIGAVPFTGPNG